MVYYVAIELQWILVYSEVVVRRGDGSYSKFHIYYVGLGPHLLTWISLNTNWRSKHVHSKVWDEIIYPFQNLKATLVKLRIDK